MEIKPGLIKAKRKGTGRSKIYTVWAIDFNKKTALISEHEYWDTKKYGLDAQEFELKELKLFTYNKTLNMT